MAISQTKYVDITSAINTTKTASEKDLIARFFIKSGVLPINQLFEFDDASEVGEFFGTESEAYKIASKYFNFINKYARKPKKIGFMRDYSGSGNGIGAFIRGTVKMTATDLNNLKAITAGEFVVTINNEGQTVSGIDLSSATDFNDVASIISTALTTASISASCEYGEGVFIIRKDGEPSSYNDGDTITVSETDLTNAMKISNSYSPLISEGTSYGSHPATELFKKSYEISNNFATFCFTYLPSAYPEITVAQIGKYINEKYPSEFMYVVPVRTTNYETIQAAVANVDGVSLELCGNREDTGLYNYVMPMAITATTDYNKENGTVNYMYMQSDDMEVVVDDDDSAKTYDQLKINYYGRTQAAGQKLAFYQNGVLQGNYQDQNIYVNEIWLKDALTTKYLNYMLATSNWYANKAGQAIGQGLAQEIINRAKLNGTITTEKEITENDKVYIYNITSDEEAWRQIYQEGYYLITSITVEKINNQDIHKFNFTLLYSKGDSIKKVEGKDILI